MESQAKPTNQGVIWQEVLDCCLCGTRGTPLYQELGDRLYNVPGAWSVMRCESCGMVWLHPRPIPQETGKLYQEYVTHGATLPSQQRKGARAAIRDAILASMFGYSDLVSEKWLLTLGHLLGNLRLLREMAELGVMSLPYRPEGTLLDIGCGNGAFLHRMRHLGWTVSGVEPDQEAASVAQAHGLAVYVGTVDQADLPDNSFDAITLRHVIEHVPDPVDTIQECRRLLRPGGKLVLLTPNIDSLGHRRFREAWLHLDVPRHFYHFSPRSLSRCAQLAGFDLVNVWTSSRSARQTWLASHQIKRDGHIPGDSLRTRQSAFSVAGWAFQLLELVLCRTRDVGEEVMLVATKAN